MKNSNKNDINIIDDEKNFYIQKIKRNIEIKMKSTNLNLNELRNENLKKSKNNNNDENNNNYIFNDDYNFKRNVNNNAFINNSNPKNNLRMITNENDKVFRKDLNRDDKNKTAEKNKSLNGSRFIFQQNNSNINTQN